MASEEAASDVAPPPPPAPLSVEAGGDEQLDYEAEEEAEVEAEEAANKDDKELEVAAAAVGGGGGGGPEAEGGKGEEKGEGDGPAPARSPVTAPDDAASDSLEEGEASDEDEESRKERLKPQPVCRFYSKGQCTWGSSCREAGRSPEWRRCFRAEIRRFFFSQDCQVTSALSMLF